MVPLFKCDDKTYICCNIIYPISLEISYPIGLLVNFRHFIPWQILLKFIYYSFTHSPLNVILGLRPQRHYKK